MISETSSNISNACRVINQAVKYYQAGDPLILPMQSLRTNSSFIVFVEEGILKIEQIASEEKFALGEMKELKHLAPEHLLEKIEHGLQAFTNQEVLQVSAGLEGKIKHYKESTRNFSMVKFISAIKDKRENLILAQIPMRTSNLSLGTDQMNNAFDKIINEVGQPINYEYLEKFEIVIIRKGKSTNKFQTTLYSSRLLHLPKVRIFHHFKHGVLQNKLNEYLELVRQGEGRIIEALRKLFFKDKESLCLFEEKLKKTSATLDISWDENDQSTVSVFNKVVNFKDAKADLERDPKSGFRLKFSQAEMKAKRAYFFDIKSPAFLSYSIALLIAGNSVAKNKVLFFKNKFSSREEEEGSFLFAEELAFYLKELREKAEKALQENLIDEYNLCKEEYCRKTLKILCLCLAPDEKHLEDIPSDFFITEGSLLALAKTFFLEEAK